MSLDDNQHQAVRVRHRPTYADAEKFTGDNFPWVYDAEHPEQWQTSPESLTWYVWNQKHMYWFPCPTGWWVVRRMPGDCYVVDPESFEELWERVEA